MTFGAVASGFGCGSVFLRSIGAQSFISTIADNAINLLTARYTREAGVRQLERTIGTLARKVALKVAEGSIGKVTISAEEIKGYLGGPKFYPEEARKELPAGVATGMAWTEMGGEVLFIEATLLPG